MRCREVEALWDEIREGMPSGVPSLRSSRTAFARVSPVPGLIRRIRRRRVLPLVLEISRTVLQSDGEDRRAHRDHQAQVPQRTGLADQRWKRRSAACTSGSKTRASRTSDSNAASSPKRSASASSTGFAGPSFRLTARVDEQTLRSILHHLARRRGLRGHQRSHAVRASGSKAAAQIPPGEVRTYAWVAQTIGRPRGCAGGRTGDGAQSSSALLSVPSSRRFERRPAQLRLRHRNESPSSNDGGLSARTLKASRKFVRGHPQIETKRGKPPTKEVVVVSHT